MKILRLGLTAFGPFTGTVLDLREGQEGLHVVFGPNEAGKSSALRAIGDLLYGIPARTDDNFVHPYSRLRISATLGLGDATTIECVRRKGNQNTLRQGDDDELLDEEVLRRVLGEVDRDLFQSMFGIDHQRLRRGGEEIVRGGGRLGELLFAAEAGVANLRAVRQRLAEEMAELFKPSGRAGVILAGIKDYQQARADQKSAQVSVETWRRQEQELHEAEERKGALDRQIRGLRAEHGRLCRVKDTLPLIGRWKKATADLEDFRDVPVLGDDFADSGAAVLTEFRKAEQKKGDAQTALARLEQALSSVDVPRNLLDAADEIEALRERLGSHRKAMTDRPGLDATRDSAEQEARDALRRLGRPPDLSSCGDLRLTTDMSVRIQNLGMRYDGLVANLRAIDRDRERLRRAVARSDQQLSDPRTPADSEHLSQVARRVQQEGDLAGRLTELDGELSQLRDDAETMLERLPLWSGTLEQAERLSVPSSRTVDRFDVDLTEARKQEVACEEKLEEERRALGEIDGRLRQLALDRQVPSLEKLQEARRLREQGWRLIRKAWKEGREENDEIAEYVAEFAPAAGELADAYQLGVQVADRIADLLRTDADLVATKAKLDDERRRRAALIDSVRTERDEAGEVSRRVEEAWREVWEPVGIVPLTPPEMRDWLRRHQQVVDLAERTRSKDNEIERMRRRIDKARDDLREALRRIESPVGRDDEPLDQLLRRALDELDRLRQAENRRVELRQKLESDQSELDETDARFRQSEDDLLEWKSEWADQMARIGLQPDAMPAEANSVLTEIGALFRKLQEAEQYQVRTAGIDRDARQLQEDAERLLDRVAPDLVTKPFEEGLNVLFTRLRDAQAEGQKHATLLQQVEERKDESRRAEATLDDRRAELDEMCRRACCDRHDQLHEAARRSARRKQLEEYVRDSEQQIGSLAGGADLEAFVAEAEAEARDADTLQPRIEELEQEVERAGRQRDEVLRQVERAESAMRRIDGGAAAAEAAARSESVAAGLEERIQEVAVLRVASVILHAGIERHRAKHQAPVLRRASELFARITGDAYVGLRADFDDRGEPVLAAVRQGGVETVQVAGMSDGTCDQLYLALRLASLETWLEHHESLPFVVDDVLLNFDDERAIATLRVLADLSERTQVIFFTHHAHLVEIAEANLSPEKLFVHRLDRGAAPSGTRRKRKSALPLGETK